MNSPSLRLWRWPAVLGALTASGLVSALVSDGWGDAWSWVSLGVPVAVMTAFSLPGHASGKARRVPVTNTNHAPRTARRIPATNDNNATRQ